MKIDLSQFGKEAIDVLKNGDLFDPESLKFLNDSMEVSADVWKRVQRGRTETELRHSVLNEVSHPTPDAKYWQIYREANGQFESLVFASYEWRESKADVEIIECEIQELQFENNEHCENSASDICIRRKIAAKIAKKEIELERKSMVMMSAKASVEDRVRELRSLYKIRDELLPNIKYGTDNPNDHQLISYAQSLTMRVAIAEESGNSSPSEIANLRGVRDSCIAEIMKDDKKLDAFMNGLPAAYVDKIASQFGLTLLQNPNETRNN